MEGKPQDTDQVTDQVTDQATDQVAAQKADMTGVRGDSHHLTDQVGSLARAVEGEMTSAQIQRRMGLKHRVHFRSHYLQPALDAAVVEMTIPDKPRSNQQKYRLTEKGKRMARSGG